MAFWWHSPFSLRFYFEVPGFWLLAMAALTLLGPIALFRVSTMNADSITQRKVEIAAAAAIVVFVWIFFGFSHQYIGSWILYLFFATLAVCLLPDFFPQTRLLLGLMMLIALNSDRHQIQAELNEWRSARHSTLSRNMFSYGDEDDQIKDILSFVRGRKTAVLQYSGAFPLLHSGLGVPVNEWFSPGITLPAETSRMKSEVENAERVFVPTPRWHSTDETAFDWREMLDEGKSYQVVFKNPVGFVLEPGPKGN